MGREAEEDVVAAEMYVRAVQEKQLAEKETARWRKRAEDAEAALIAVDEVQAAGKIERSELFGTIVNAMHNLMPVQVVVQGVVVKFMSCDLFAGKDTVQVINCHGDGTFRLDGREEEIHLANGSRVARERIPPRGTTAHVMWQLNRYTGPTTGGLVCLVHPKMLTQLVQDFARMYRGAGNPTQERPGGPQ